MDQTKKVCCKLGCQELTLETGKLAKQADAAVVVRYGGTMVLVTCVCPKNITRDTDFFPLTVEYQEKTFAAGKIPGGFFKREGRPSEKAILTSRMIDRPIRPLFPEGMMNEVQVIATVLSLDEENDSDIIAVIGASAALTISDIPFDGPIGAVRVGMIDDKFILNPTFKEMTVSKLDLIVVANEHDVVMLEAEADRMSEARMVEAIKFAHDNIKTILNLQNEFRKLAGKPKRTEYSKIELKKDLFERMKKEAGAKLKSILQMKEKQKRVDELELLVSGLLEKEVKEDEDETKVISAKDVKYALETLEKEVVRDIILNEKKRVDGRKFDETRQLSSETNLLPRAHGSALFTRGETQSLAVTTLGTGSDEQIIDALEGEFKKTFMLHYNFPPFSVGEARQLKSPGRREIGHGALAAKSFSWVLPSQEVFPYTIRIVSEILESNGSSSMATVCASSMSLMSAGVPVKDAVSGVAMGLIKNDKTHVILTDIAGVEDHYGDMDFKVAGTKDGITAVQMDLKIKGLSYDILKEAFDRAREGRLHILNHMNTTIAQPAGDLSPTAPRIVTIHVKAEKIKDVIGPGGKVIKKIIADTGVDINIEDDGTCRVASANKEALDKAVAIISGIIEEPEVGKIYDGTITRIMNFGAFCEFLPGQEGLIHVSELSSTYVKDVKSVVKEGDAVKVILFEIDEQGRNNLSIKRVNNDQNAAPEQDKK
ncbi:MAG TPA: polyribonucleotide nucleotidyltransferase [Candidatus Omnitrophota bacterium]|nr:polyribonucleotide nucleotidyltransferase [Candidatus Omnitrophota bacterium]HPS20300.1 polyribonucleotide nucleotidyltransferase [Candidatus Omnitrophota bacterium]